MKAVLSGSLMGRFVKCGPVRGLSILNLRGSSSFCFGKTSAVSKQALLELAFAPFTANVRYCNTTI